MIRPGFDLDFVPSGPLTLTRASGSCAALALALWLAILFVGPKGEPTADAQQPVAPVAARPPAPEPLRAQWTQAQRQSVEKASRALQVPWAQWIDRTAKAAPAGVSLLSFEPDVNTGLLSLQAEANRMASMVKYVRLLEQDNHLGQALLREFESVPESTKVRFTIDASLQGTRHGGRP
jgi:hypothetical protein